MKKIASLLTALLLTLTASAYDFSAVSPSGHTLYYNIENGNMVTLTSKYTSFPYWSGEMPTGALTIPSSVTYGGTTYSVISIGNKAFYGCTGLTSVTIPNGVTSIESSAFYCCYDLTSVTIPNSVTSIGSAFDHCTGLTSITIPNSVISIGNYAFNYCSSLNSITIPNSVTTIGTSAFSNCSSLTSITIPNSVTTIGTSAFSNCSSLTSITIPNSVTSIGNSAFRYCSSLTSVTIGCSVDSIGNFAFSNCGCLISIAVSSANIIYNSRNNCNAIIKTATNALVAGCNNTIIPNTVISIDQYAFYGCSSMTSVIIPNSVTSIGDKAFYDCSNLTFVIIGCSVTSIGNYAFSGCSNLAVMYMKPTTPPALVNNYSIGYNVIDVIVSRNSYTAYTHAGDKYTRHRICMDSVYVTVTVNDTTRGHVRDTLLTYPYPDTLILEALPYYGYHFTCWDDNSTSSIRLVANITHDTNLTAYFDKNQYVINLTVDTNIHGNCTGMGNYDYLSSCTIHANANHGYHFTHWNDGVTDNPRTISLTQDTSFTAHFGINKYGVAGISNNSNMGTVAGSDSVYYLDTVVLTATANYGYHFSHWNDNNTDNPRTVVATDNITLTAIFDYNQYVLTVGVDNPVHGTVSGGGSYNYLSGCTIAATANYGYHFDHWSNGSTTNPTTITIERDSSVTAIFAPNRYTLTLQSNNNHGQVSGGGEYDYLDTAAIMATAEAHYHLVHWSDGNTDNSRQYVITEDVSLTAYFAIDTHTVTVQANDMARGMVQASGTDFAYGTPCTVTATAYSGYCFVGWSNGAQYNPYTFAVLQDTSLTAIFEETQGIDDVNVDEIVIQVSAGHITVLGAEGMDVRVFDMMGRRIAYSNAAEEHDIPIHTAGVYLVKVGTLPARKVVVIR